MSCSRCVCVCVEKNWDEKSYHPYLRVAIRLKMYWCISSVLVSLEFIRPEKI